MKLKNILLELITKQELYSLTFYHGTNSDITFKDLKNSNLAGDYGEGIYLTTDKQHAQRHGKYVISGKVKPDNPIEIGSPQYFEKIYPELPGASQGIPQMSYCSSIAKKNGFDAIIVERNSDDTWCILLKDGLTI